MWTDGRTDGRTDRQRDKVITIGLPHLRWRGPNKLCNNSHLIWDLFLFCKGLQNYVEDDLKNDVNFCIFA